MSARILSATAILSCLFVATANAQTWDGGAADNNWFTANNWNPDFVPINNGTVNIVMAGIVDLTNVVNINFDINSLTFNNTAGAFVINNLGGTTLTIRGGGITNQDAQTQTINAPLILFTGQTWNAASGSLTIGGTVNLGTNQLVADGAFTTTISGTVQNTSGAIVKNGVGTLDLSGNNLHTGGLLLNNGVFIVSNNGAAGTGTLTLSGGAIQAGASPKTLGNAVTLGGNFSVSGAFDMNFSGATTLTGNRTITVSNGVTTFSGAIGEDVAGRIFTKVGTGTLTFSGGSANIYTGNTFVNAGTLLLSKTAGVNAIAAGAVVVGDGAGGVNADVVRLGASNQFADDAGVTSNSSGLFDLNGFSETMHSVTLAGGNVTTGAGTLTLTSGLFSQPVATTGTIAGFLNLNGGDRIFFIDNGMAATDVNVSAVISNGGVIKSGPGTILFSGGLANTYTGTTTVTEGQLVLSKSVANGAIVGNLIVGDGAGVGIDQVVIETANQIANTANVTVNDGAELAVVANEDGFGLLTLNGGTVGIDPMRTLTLTNDVVVNDSASMSMIAGLNQQLILSGARTFTVNDDGLPETWEFETTTSVQGGTIVKAGIGAMRLTGGANNSAALTVNAGEVIAAKTSVGVASMTGSVVIGDGIGGIDADILRIGNNEQIDQTASDTLTINSSGLLNLNGNDETIGNLVLNGGSTTSGTLRFLGNVTVNANSQTAEIGSDLFLDFGTTDFAVENGAAAVDLDVGGDITSGTLNKTGDGTMRLGFNTTADNTVTINVNQGTMLLRSFFGPAIEGILNVGDGVGGQGTDIARLEANDQIDDSATALSVQSSGLLDLNGFSDTVGALYISGGAITTGAGTLSLGNFLETFDHPLTSSVAGNVHLGTAPRPFKVHDGAAVIDLDVTATLTAGVGGQLVKEGAGTMQLSGTQNVPIVLNTGALSATFTIGPIGSLTQNAGTLSGTLTNQGTFTYNGGTFTGQLINEGTATLGAGFTAGNGIINFGNFTVGAAQSVTANGTGFDNQGTITLAGGTIGGSGPLVNNSVLTGRGTIAGSAGFSNNGQITISGGNFSLTNSGANTNAGLITVPVALQLRLLGGNLTNTGIIDLDGGSISGTATLVNAAGGTVEGGSSVQMPMSNDGGLIHANSGSTLLITNLSGGNINGGELRIENSSGINVTSAFASSGTIVLLGADAQLIGGAVTNTGTLRGTGRASNTVLNSGTVLAESGRLTLSGSGHTNTAAGIVEAHAAAEVFYSQGLATNAGQIALVGGTFDNNNRTLANSGSVAGDGVIRTGGLTNTGSIGVGGGDLDLVGPVTNNSTVSIQSGSTARFFGPVNGPGNYSGTGTTMFLNSFSPGASPAQVSFGGNLVFGGAASLIVELAGTTPGTQYDRLVVAGSAALNGSLDVDLLDDFVPAAGNVFQIISAAGGVAGTFANVSLPTLTNANWQLRYEPTAVYLQVALPGDYNFNGTVDAADFVVWRNSVGLVGTGLAADGDSSTTIDSSDYSVWRANFGNTAGSGAGAGAKAAVPEPATAVALILAAAGLCLRRRQAA